MSQSITTYSDSDSIFDSITHGSDMNTIVLTINQGVLDLLPDNISLQLNYNPLSSQTSPGAPLFASIQLPAIRFLLPTFHFLLIVLAAL